MPALREAELADIVRASPNLMRVLECARGMGLPDWMVVSGAVYQTVWNHLTGRDPDYGIKDFDLFYFYGEDLSYEHEDIMIRGAESCFPPDLSARVEVRNQARVHLWFETRFGEPYAPLASSAEALTRFVAPAFAVGVWLGMDDNWVHIAAPFGLEDLFAMRLRPNPLRPQSRNFETIAAGVKARWPEVVVEG
jgi:hypothetical protein